MLTLQARPQTCLPIATVLLALPQNVKLQLLLLALVQSCQVRYDDLGTFLSWGLRRILIEASNSLINHILRFFLHFLISTGSDYGAAKIDSSVWGLATHFWRPTALIRHLALVSCRQKLLLHVSNLIVVVKESLRGGPFAALHEDGSPLVLGVHLFELVEALGFRRLTDILEPWWRVSLHLLVNILGVKGGLFLNGELLLLDADIDVAWLEPVLVLVNPFVFKACF